MTTYYIIVGKMKDSEPVVCFDSEGPHSRAIYTDPQIAIDTIDRWRREWTDTVFRLVKVDYD